MTVSLRPLRSGDLDEIVRLSLAAWEPVFVSFREVLGPAVYPLLYPDWTSSQAEAVASICNDPKYTVWVAEVNGGVVGFIAYELNPQTKVGTIELLAVHPDHQNGGIGTQLNALALDRMREGRMELAEVGTGGDPGHAPARRAYEKAGFNGFPLVRYYQALGGEGEV
jgi:RimJ/RimL family protein N-acetyltransferase